MRLLVIIVVGFTKKTLKYEVLLKLFMEFKMQYYIQGLSLKIEFLLVILLSYECNIANTV